MDWQPVMIVLLWIAALTGSAVAETDAGLWADTHLGEIDPQTAYGSAEDKIPHDQAAELLLQLTNASRQQVGLPTLTLMESATQVAQLFSDEMAQQQRSGHRNQDGYACELRFNMVGGVDHIQENTAYYEIQHSVYLTPQLVERIHGHWMSSDSHRRNVLDPNHTHLGAGFAVVRTEELTYVAGVAEFVNDYGDYTRLPQVAQPGDVLHLEGQLDRDRAALRYIGIGIGELPVPLAAAPAQPQSVGYAFPKVVLALLPHQTPGTLLPEIKFVRHNVEYSMLSGAFAAPIELDADWPPGAYYITVWADRQGAAGWVSAHEANKPVCVMTQVLLVE